MSLKNCWTAALLGVATLGAAFGTSAAALETQETQPVQTTQPSANVGVARGGEAGEKPAVRGAWGDSATVSVALADAFRFTLAGEERVGFAGAGDVASSVEVREFETAPDDRFPRRPVRTETRSCVDVASGLKITCEKTTYVDFPIVETVVWFENVSTKNSPNLRDVWAVDVLLPTGAAPRLGSGVGEDSDPKRNYLFETSALNAGERRSFTPREAYSSFGAFPFFTLEGDATSYILAVGWTGRWTADFEAVGAADGKADGASTGVRFRAGQAGVDLYLKPGEKVRTPRVTLVQFPTGTDGTNLWRDWFRRYIMPRERGVVLRPKLALDVFYRGELYDQVTAEEQIAAIRKLRALGYPCDALWIDAGWYRRSQEPVPEGVTLIGTWFLAGDWTPDPARFPNGLKPVAEELARGPENGGVGGKLVLWFEPERVHRSCVTPELSRYLVPNCEAVESRRMNLAAPETVDYLSRTIGDALVENGVSIYRQDSNGAGPLVFLESLEANDPNFNDRKGFAENLYVQGLYEFWSNLKKRVPDLIFDTCASGGRRNDLEILRHGAVPLHYSDVGYFDFVEKERVRDVLNRWFVYCKNIDPHDFDFERGEYDVFKTTIDLSAFSTVRPYFLENPSEANRRYVERFLTVGETLVDGDYYLLNDGFSVDAWAAWQFDDAERGVGFVAVVRNEKAEDATLNVVPKALCADARYRWTNLETNETREIAGADALRTGVEVALPPRSGSVWRYERVER